MYMYARSSASKPTINMKRFVCILALLLTAVTVMQAQRLVPYNHYKTWDETQPLHPY